MFYFLTMSNLNLFLLLTLSDIAYFHLKNNVLWLKSIIIIYIAF